MAALAKRDGVTLQDRLDDIAERFGRHVTAERSVRVDPPAMPALMAKLRANPPATLAGAAVTDVQDVAAADLLRLLRAATSPGCRSARAAPSRR